jgi:hypothetical protein
MEVVEALTLARRSVEEADLPPQWQDLAFREVLRSLLAGVQTEEPRPFAATQSDTSRPHSGGPTSPRMAQVAVRLGVSEPLLADVFSIEDDALTLHVSSGRISATKSKATREIALLVVAARQASGIDESWTAVNHVRDTLAQYSRYDTSNFAKYLRETDDVFNLRGKPVQHLRLTRPGWEAAAALAQSLTGSAS